MYFAIEVIPIWVLWAESIYYLGAWTFRVWPLFIEGFQKVPPAAV